MTLHFLVKPSPAGRTPTPADRRQTRRIVPRVCTLCLVQDSEQETPRLGFLQNLSVKGLGFRIGMAFAPGARLPLLLINAAHTYALAVELEVVRCSPCDNWGFYVGGSFCHPMKHEELIPLLL